MGSPSSRKTRRIKRKGIIEHHHLLLRLETEKCPRAADRAAVKELLDKIIAEIGMNPLDTTRIYYVTQPIYNEGMTAIVPIQTSHIAFHFWSAPEASILTNPKSKCLLQMDLYTCGKLTRHQVGTLLHHLTRFQPTHTEITLLNRKYGLSLERHTHWDVDNDNSWPTWINKHFLTRLDKI